VTSLVQARTKARTSSCFGEARELASVKPGAARTAGLELQENQSQPRQVCYRLLVPCSHSFHWRFELREARALVRVQSYDELLNGISGVGADWCCPQRCTLPHATHILAKKNGRLAPAQEIDMRVNSVAYMQVAGRVQGRSACSI
jgi:hypothetical protein